MKWLQPLLPETRMLNGNISSSIHSPIVVSATLASGSICHHLQFLHKPHSLLMTFLRLVGRNLNVPVIAGKYVMIIGGGDCREDIVAASRLTRLSVGPGARSGPERVRGKSPAHNEGTEFGAIPTRRGIAPYQRRQPGRLPCNLARETIAASAALRS